MAAINDSRMYVRVAAVVSVFAGCLHRKPLDRSTVVMFPKLHLNFGLCKAHVMCFPSGRNSFLSKL
jgi:hypothetical protein